MKNLKVTGWIFKINNQTDGQGIAILNING